VCVHIHMHVSSHDSQRHACKDDASCTQVNLPETHGACIVNHVHACMQALICANSNFTLTQGLCRHTSGARLAEWLISNRYAVLRATMCTCRVQYMCDWPRCLFKVDRDCQVACICVHVCMNTHVHLVEMILTATWLWNRRLAQT
jgi:hypothetical protein